MAQLKHLAKKHADVLAYLLIVLAMGYALDRSQNDTKDKVHAAQIEACERGNILRKVVYKNTRTAVKQAVDGSPAEASFQDQLDLMKDTPHRYPDGTLDCEVVVPDP